MVPFTKIAQRCCLLLPIELLLGAVNNDLCYDHQMFKILCVNDNLYLLCFCFQTIKAKLKLLEVLLAKHQLSNWTLDIQIDSIKKSSFAVGILWICLKLCLPPDHCWSLSLQSTAFLIIWCCLLLQLYIFNDLTFQQS